ncbi:MAG TPA: exopolyphosphatase, partial [Pirellulaceae bacterium]|nr:exopolyphosphatase [Pirellulaceae bacterium]
EVGGGTTEVLFLRDTDVLFSRTFRMGALRMLLSLESLAAGADQNRKFLEAHILQHIQQIQHLVHDETASYVAMGSDIRFAAKELGVPVTPQTLTEIPMNDLSKFVDRVLAQPADKLAVRHRLSIADAHALGPALLAHLLLARRFNSDRIFVAQVNLRDGLLMEMAHGRIWPESIQRQVVRSAQACGKKYDYDEKHAEHVAFLACTLFDQLKPLHGLDHRYQALLHMAGLLHEIGLYVGGRSYHKHSMYLIQNTEFFGIGQKDLQLIGLIARYHRRATPQPNHEGYDKLDRDSRIIVAKLASILRVAVALDALRSQRITHVDSICEGNRVRLKAHGLSDLTAEHLELRHSGQMFEQLFGVHLTMESGDEVL